jgi:hypothetical protein
MDAAEQVKFAELRAKTDRDLLVLINRGLERAYRDYAAGFRTDALATYQETDRLLSVIRAVPAGHWLRLEAQLTELRGSLGEERATLASTSY